SLVLHQVGERWDQLALANDLGIDRTQDRKIIHHDAVTRHCENRAGRHGAIWNDELYVTVEVSDNINHPGHDLHNPSFSVEDYGESVTASLLVDRCNGVSNALLHAVHDGAKNREHVTV